jgi:transcriptional regulator with GAF, ATPase, and Fis domain
MGCVSFRTRSRQRQRLFVLDAPKRNAWNVTRSAEETGMLRPNFQALMKKYNIRVRDTEQSQESDGP